MHLPLWPRWSLILGSGAGFTDLDARITDVETYEHLGWGKRWFPEVLLITTLRSLYKLWPLSLGKANLWLVHRLAL